MPTGGTRSANKGKEKEQGKEYESSSNSEKEEEIGENNSNKPIYLPGFSAEQVESLITFINRTLAAHLLGFITQLKVEFSEKMMTLRTIPGMTKIPNDFN